MTLLRRLPGVAVASLAFLLWSSAFLLLYVAVSLGCAWGWDWPAALGLSLQRWVLLGVWAVHLALLGALLAWSWRGTRWGSAEDAFRPVLATGGLGLALAATLWCGLPVLLASACH